MTSHEMIRKTSEDIQMENEETDLQFFKRLCRYYQKIISSNAIFVPDADLDKLPEVMTTSDIDILMGLLIPMGEQSKHWLENIALNVPRMTNECYLVIKTKVSRIDLIVTKLLSLKTKESL